MLLRTLFLCAFLVHLSVQQQRGFEYNEDDDDEDFDDETPHHYDYHGFSRGSGYKDKKESGDLDKAGHGHEGGKQGSRSRGGDGEGEKKLDEGYWEIDCGDLRNRYMTIHHYGFGYKMYASDNSKCLATEGEGHHHFILEDVWNDKQCRPLVHKMPDMDVFTLEVVIQTHPHIRTHKDPVTSITCNYERAGATQSSVRTDSVRIKEHQHKQRSRNMKNVNKNVELNMNVNISVLNTDGKEIREAYMGQYIQLRAFYHTREGVGTSFKFFHCVAESAKTPKNKYDILVKGCGDGDVIDADKGFFTARERGPNYLRRSSTSVFFEAFTIPEGDEVIYTCDYVICWDVEDCDGASCRDGGTRAKTRSRGSGDFGRAGYGSGEGRAGFGSGNYGRAGYGSGQYGRSRFGSGDDDFSRAAGGSGARARSNTDSDTFEDYEEDDEDAEGSARKRRAAPNSWEPQTSTTVSTPALRIRQPDQEGGDKKKGSKKQPERKKLHPDMEKEKSGKKKKTKTKDHKDKSDVVKPRVNEPGTDRPRWNDNTEWDVPVEKSSGDDKKNLLLIISLSAMGFVIIFIAACVWIMMSKSRNQKEQQPPWSGPQAGGKPYGDFAQATPYKLPRF